MTSKLQQQETDTGNDPGWNDIRNHDYSRSFPSVKDFIRRNAPVMKRAGKRRRRITWLLLVMLPLLFFFSCKRNSYMDAQGATLSFIANDSLLNTIDHTLQLYADKHWKAVFWPKGGTMRGVISTSADQYDKLKQLCEKLKIIPGVTELYLSAITTSIKEPPLSRLTYKLFNLHFNAINVSDDQLRLAIASRLKETGPYGLQLQLVKENGRKQVNIATDNKIRNFSVELTLVDGSNIKAMAERW